MQSVEGDQGGTLRQGNKQLFEEPKGDGPMDRDDAQTHCFKVTLSPAGPQAPQSLSWAPGATKTPPPNDTPNTHALSLGTGTMREMEKDLQRLRDDKEVTA